MIPRWSVLLFLLIPNIASQIPRSNFNDLSPLWSIKEIPTSVRIETKEDAFKRELLKDSMDMVAILQTMLVPLVGEISDQCRRDSEMFINALNNGSSIIPGNGWAYKMLDAAGFIPPSGLLQGNLMWLGNFDSCLEVEAPTFKGQHCTMGISDGPPDENFGGRAFEPEGVNPVEKYLRSLREPREQGGQFAYFAPLAKFGRCVPASCSEEDVRNGFTAALRQLDANTTFQANIDACHSKDESKPLDAGDKAMVFILSLFGALILIGTLVDVMINQVKFTKFPNWVVQVFLGFSAITNTIKIFSTKNVKSSSMNSINGIRFISMTWVLFSHAYSAFQGRIPVNNFLVLFDKDGPLYGNVAFQAILNGFPSVDTFFFIGAFLLSFLTMKELDKRKGGDIKFWMMYYIHRYIRLTGVYAMILAFIATLVKYFAVGPMSSPIMIEREGCRANWWLNLLYINNLHWIVPEGSPSQFSCLGQTWYLACDMQYYLISPLLIVPMWKLPNLYAALWGLLWVIGGTLIPAISTAAWDFPFSFSLAGQNGDLIGKFFIDFYVVSWQRFQPYIMGVIGGWLMYKMRDEPRLKLNPFMVMWIWAVMGVIGALVVYGLYPAQTELMETGIGPVGSLTARVIYQGFHRLAWSLGVGWVIIACEKGAGGPINSILSWHLWIPLARLSYTIYLVHMMVISYFTSLPSFTVTFSQLLAVYWILAQLCFSIFVAYIAVIVFEAPIVHIEKLFFALLGIGKMPQGIVKDKPEDNVDSSTDKKNGKIHEPSVSQQREQKTLDEEIKNDEKNLPKDVESAGKD